MTGREILEQHIATGWTDDETVGWFRSTYPGSVFLFEGERIWVKEPPSQRRLLVILAALRQEIGGVPRRGPGGPPTGDGLTIEKIIAALVASPDPWPPTEEAGILDRSDRRVRQVLKAAGTTWADAIAEVPNRGGSGPVVRFMGGNEPTGGLEQPCRASVR